MTQRTTFHGRRQDLRALLRRLPAILAEREPDPWGIVAGLKRRLGNAFLLLVTQAFLVKSRGGIGSDAIKWRRISPRTIARKRALGRQTGICRETDRYLRSLAPGTEDRPSGAPEQVFETPPGLIRIGSQVPYAEKNAKVRPLWTDPLPAGWWQYMLGVYRDALARELALALSRKRP